MELLSLILDELKNAAIKSAKEELYIWAKRNAIFIDIHKEDGENDRDLAIKLLAYTNEYFDEIDEDMSNASVELIEKRLACISYMWGILAFLAKDMKMNSNGYQEVFEKTMEMQKTFFNGFNILNTIDPTYHNFRNSSDCNKVRRYYDIAFDVLRKYAETEKLSKFESLGIIIL